MFKSNNTIPVVLLLAFFNILGIGGNVLADSTNQSLSIVPTDPVEPPPIPRRVFDGNVTHVSEFPIKVVPDAWFSVSTANCSSGTDPVLHLINSDNNREVAFNDNGGGGVNAHIDLRIRSNSIVKNLILIVRSRSQESGGRCNLLFSGSPWKTNVVVGGWHVEMDGLRKNESIETVRLPNGAGSGHRLYILRPNGQGIDIYQQAGSVAGAAKRILRDFIGKRTVVIGVPQSSQTGVARLLRNDAAFADIDNDGIGLELEKSLGTCSTNAHNNIVTGQDGVSFNCGLIADARDTDGDGISDGVEALGKLYVPKNKLLSRGLGKKPSFELNKDIALPLWGADPRHKDLFIEVDFMRRNEQENQSQKILMMKASAARNFAKIYSDGFQINENILAENARILRNPDGRAGINVHLDIGRNPESPEDATIYGDWGGFNSVDAIEDGGSWKGVAANDAWLTNLSEDRRGIFRYTMGFNSGGSQCNVGFACAFNFYDPVIPAHEMGHTMELGHSGPSNITADIDPQCKPNYPSIMNYAFLSSDNGFSDGTIASAPALNNWHLVERNGVSPTASSFLNLLKIKYKYYVDLEQGHVDWDRNGTIAPAGQTVRAYANFRPATGCEYTRYNQRIIPNSASTKSPSLVRLHDRLYVFFSVLGSALYNVSTSSWDCPVPAKNECGNSSWGDLSISVNLDSQGGIDAERYKAGSNSEVVVVTIDGDGKLRDRRLSINSSGSETWSSAENISSSPAAGEPTLARVDACVVYLAYRGVDGMLRTNRMSCASNWQWEGEKIALPSTGANIQISSNASPALIRAYLPWNPAAARLYGAFTSVEGNLDIWMFNSQNGRWEKTNVIQEKVRKVKGRPAMAWVPFQSGSEHLGRFYLTYISDQSNKYPDQIRMQMSYVKVTKMSDDSLQGDGRVGLDSPFDNVWYKGWGIDLLYESGVDSNLRSVIVSKIPKPGVNYSLIFRPKSDGINDFEYVNYSDWETLQSNLCKHVVNPGEMVANPIVCTLENDPKPSLKKVPFLREIRKNVALQMVIDAGLKPVFTGTTNDNQSWVNSQSPAPGTMVKAGSTVSMHLRSGSIP